MTALLLGVAGDAVRSSAQASVCPPGQQDYGSGLVAHALPPDVEAAVHEWQTCLTQRLAHTGFATRSLDASRPHLSLLYGVEPTFVPALDEALQQFVKHTDLAPLKFADVHYWDNPQKDVTVLVLQVVDASRSLHALQSQLVALSGRPEHHPFSPHVTLAYLPLGARLPPEICASFQAALASAWWRPCDFFVTNRCGQALRTASCAAPARGDR